MSTGDRIAAGGRSVEDIVEGGAGGEFSRALILSELGSAVETAEAEFAYDDDKVARDFVRLCRDLRAHLERLSVTKQAGLTLNRQCRSCSGAGDPDCLECAGRGYVHADEADG